jgi:hypothetical protein
MVAYDAVRVLLSRFGLPRGATTPRKAIEEAATTPRKAIEEAATADVFYA